MPVTCIKDITAWAWKHAKINQSSLSLHPQMQDTTLPNQTPPCKEKARYQQHSEMLSILRA